MFLKISFRFTLQFYIKMDEKLGEIVSLRLAKIRFVNNQMTNDWYIGQHYLFCLQLQECNIEAIHEDAFTDYAFARLKVLIFKRNKAPMHIYDHALEGIRLLEKVAFIETHISNMHRHIFHSIIGLLEIDIDRWPNAIGLNDMFNERKYRKMHTLKLSNVEVPQTKFHVLSADNFTTFRCLRHLSLTNCGIEIIKEHTFDMIGETLQHLNLNRNRIQFIYVEMFRHIYEHNMNFRFQMNVHASLKCTCGMIEVYLMQFINHSMPEYICIRDVHFLIDTCGSQQLLNSAKWGWPGRYLRCFHMHLSHVHESIVVRTTFSRSFRMLYGDAKAMQTYRCDAKTTNTQIGCLIIRKVIDRLELSELDAINDTTELIMITVIPFLYEAKVCPIHLITVRRSMETEDATWHDSVTSIPLLIASCILGFSIGFVCVSAGVLGWMAYGKWFKQSSKTRKFARGSISNVSEKSMYEYYSYIQQVNERRASAGDIADVPQDRLNGKRNSYEYIGNPLEITLALAKSKRGSF